MDVRKTLFDNWSIKLLSFCLSLTLWFYVTSKGKTEITLTIPIELRNTPQNMAIVGDVTSSMEVRVQGQERVLRDITIGKKIFCVADLSMTTVGENVVRVSPDDIIRPAGVSIAFMSLSEIPVRLEPLVRKTYRLKPILYGSPASGFRVAKISVSPLRVTAEGPTTVMQSLEILQTMPIDIQGAREDMTVEPKIDYRGLQAKILENDILIRISFERTRK